MRKIIFVLATLMFAAPALAGVTICTQTSGNEVTLTYDASAEAELVRAFALDITVQGATITAVKNPNPSYDIYPGSIVIMRTPARSLRMALLSETPASTKVRSVVLAPTA